MEWISVNDRLPEDYEPVLYWHTSFLKGDSAVAQYVSDGDYWKLFHTSTDDEPIGPPTHWAELPSPPKTK